MCTHKTKVFNKYNGKYLYVSCGRCPACQQEKANRRAARIRANRSPGKMALFVHLTYLNECVPYILKSDLESRPDDIPVYRDYDRRWSRVSGRKRSYLLRYYRQHDEVDRLDLINKDGSSQLDNYDSNTLTKNLKDLKNTYHRRPTTLPMSGKIGIIYYPDVQNFIKKLRINLKRLYDIPSDSFSVYISSEYGEDGYRPHFHLLVFFDKALETQFRDSILKSWTYAFRNITSRRLERAIDASKYCASYVNKPSDFPPVLSARAFKAKSSHSMGFGFSLPAFKLDEVLRKVREGSLKYVRTSYINGSPVKCDVPYPSYVICGYFPKFKGFFRLADSEIHQLGRYSYQQTRIQEQDPFTKEWTIESISQDNIDKSFHDVVFSLLAYSDRLEYTADDVIDVATYIHHKAQQCNMSIYDYLIAWTDVHRCYRSTLYRNLLEDRDLVSQWQCYNNIEDYFTGLVRNDSLDFLMFLMPNDYVYEVDPNNFFENVALTGLLEEQFSKYVKVRKINACFDENDF